MFYHVNLDISITDILSLCNIKSDNTNRKIKIDSFVRPDIASKNDITFVNNNKYSVKTNAMFVITNKHSFTCCKTIIFYNYRTIMKF